MRLRKKRLIMNKNPPSARSDMKKYAEKRNNIIESKKITRRHFVKLTGITALGVSSLGLSGFTFNGVSIVLDPEDKIARMQISEWAVKELEKSLIARGIDVFRCSQLSGARSGDLCIAVAGSDSRIARKFLKSGKIAIPEKPEALGLIPVNSAGRQILLTAGYDARGLMYAVLELTDRVLCSSQPLKDLYLSKLVIEKPANVIRGINRLFVSEIEDKGWFNDREMWPQYLTMLATQRFNRFSLSLGIGYDFLQNVTDGYFLFPYPFFLTVQGYQVRVPQLSDAERDKNLEMLRFISEQAETRGIHFQLGLWMHGYQWLNSPNPNYTIEGLSPETHASYCRDAVCELLKQCPAIRGVTFRVHGESGVTEGSYNFWKTIFEGVAACGRNVEIDMHAKGMDQTMIETAVASGLPVNISPKYWAEHLGMPYHQADIRALEIPKAGNRGNGLMNLSAGSRSFTRYGYADLLKEDRKYGVLHRIWPGTQRLLLWGDPLVSAAHSKAFSFCGSVGVDLMEPLSFKGRRGSGIAGDRCGYLDTSLKPRWDWEKYLYSLRIFGRLAYNPDTEPDVWRRYLKKEFGKSSDVVEMALANVTRILPIVLTVHGASAGNNTYWPEMYTNMSIPDPANTNPYTDSPSPRVFGNVSPTDPQLFLGINEFAKELLASERSGKYSPVEAAQWIEDYCDAAAGYLEKAENGTTDMRRPEFRRMAIDTAIVIGLGRFFAAKIRSGVLFGIYQQSGDKSALGESLSLYRKARGFWADLSERARVIYKPDITIGENPVIRGHWLDRLPTIDKDIDFMAGLLENVPSESGSGKEAVKVAVGEAIGRPVRTKISVKHPRPVGYKPGNPINIEISLDMKPSTVLMHYRHVNHAERFITSEMTLIGSSYKATIPVDYTRSDYPLQYYFEFKDEHGKAWLYPGFSENLDNQPYFILRNV
jgi:hypothetical protein